MKQKFILECIKETIVLDKKSLEYAPGGTHTVSATLNGEPSVVTVIVDEAAAQRLDEELQHWIAEAALGRSARPFVDFDHEGKSAAAIPTRFYWDDGIRLDVEWTSSGKEALEGRNYSYFSPTVLVDPETGQFTGLPSSGPIGSLVNNPAFQNIQRLAAASSNPKPQPKMDELEKIQKQLEAAESKLEKQGEQLVELQALLDTATTEHGEKDSKLEASAEEIQTLEAKVESLREEKISANIDAKNIKDENREAVLAACLKADDDGAAILAAFEAPKSTGTPPLKKEDKKVEEPKGLARLTAAINENLKAKALI